MRLYEINYERAAEKALKAIRDRRIALPLRAAIEDLAIDPRPPGCRKLTGRKDDWRIRVGDWRVIYRIDDGALVVLVVELGARGGIYT